jgi:hypothetical protein
MLDALCAGLYSTASDTLGVIPGMGPGSNRIQLGWWFAPHRGDHGARSDRGHDAADGLDQPPLGLRTVSASNARRETNGSTPVAL